MGFSGRLLTSGANRRRVYAQACGEVIFVEAACSVTPAWNPVIATGAPGPGRRPARQAGTASLRSRAASTWPSGPQSRGCCKHSGNRDQRCGSAPTHSRGAPEMRHMTQLQAAVADLVVVKVEDDGRERYAGERQRRPGAVLAAVSFGPAVSTSAAPSLGKRWSRGRTPRGVRGR